MLNKFVTTDNVKRTLAALDPLLGEMDKAIAQGRPPAVERGLTLVEGRTGTGKTEMGTWIATQFGFVRYLRAARRWSGAWLVEDFAIAAGLPDKGTTKANLRQLQTELRRCPCIFVLDEADRIWKQDLIETMRDIYDLTKCPIILMSAGGGNKFISRKNPATWRRLGQVIEYRTLSATEVRIIWEDLSEVAAPLSQEQAEQVLQHSQGGSFGEVMVTLADLERKLKANPQAGLTPKVLQMALRRAV